MGALRMYLDAAREWRERGGAPVPFWHLPRYYRRWRGCLGAPGRSPLADGAPWMTFAAADFLARAIGPRDRVFEWGMGGSSLFFARRAGQVVSVEHEAGWFGTARDRIAASGAANWEGYLVEPPVDDGVAEGDPADPGVPVSSDPRFRGRDFRGYAAFIDRYADGHFDVVVVDGRARPSCLRHAMPKAARLIVLDNAERPHYGAAREMLRKAGWTPRAFAGPTRYNVAFSCTEVWSRGGAALSFSAHSG